MRKPYFFFLGMMINFICFALVSCDKTNDERTYSSSLIRFTQQELCYTKCKNCGDDSEEKLICKILTNGRLKVTHKNVYFDSFSVIDGSVTIENKTIILTENGKYGISGNYSRYELIAIIGGLSDGTYTLIVKRNGTARGVFTIIYESYKAKDND